MPQSTYAKFCQSVNYFSDIVLVFNENLTNNLNIGPFNIGGISLRHEHYFDRFFMCSLVFAIAIWP